MLKKQFCFLGFMAIIYSVPILDLFPFPESAESIGADPPQETLILPAVDECAEIDDAFLVEI